jgi:uncharacterized iron-regulated membrane protein
MEAPFRWPRFVRNLHRWLALIVGAQLVVWSLTGFYMVAVHIGYIHGDHLVRAEAAIPADPAELIAPFEVVRRYPEAGRVELTYLFRHPAWRVDEPSGAFLVNARTGERLPPLGRAEIHRRALEIYTGKEPIASIALLEETPREIGGRKPPIWRVTFAHWNEPTLYISPTTGALLTRRHQLWRVFDIAWMLHIMDYEGRENVNNLLLRVVTVAAAALALSGAWLLFWSFPRRQRKRA